MPNLVLTRSIGSSSNDQIPSDGRFNRETLLSRQLHDEDELEEQMATIRRLHHYIDKLNGEIRQLAECTAMLEREKERLQNRIRTVESQIEANVGSQMPGDAGVQDKSQAIAVFQHEHQVQEMQDNHQAVYEQLVERQSAEQLQAEQRQAEQRQAGQ
ncbi:hypothetical protein BU26DRAFT_508442 [Trematosphaeria pertusa]|uniref:Uncharacterized protein n=1 Tax=Trematosphaeria pertusa TaxID=390896 RepID=A0A6A6I570_9PLEO|nr:uncharacterized protein BU26DRAFT_508442 [Trematosphaeria pertusa]KAF2245102.1 hypothetical protein BU26DRAFT_508442 [Trematosphaeria pertusa]